MSGEVPPLRLFVDESYGQEDYYVAGVLLTPSQYERLATQLAALRLHAAERFGLPEDIELHAHRLMQTRGPWKPLHGQFHEAVLLYRQVLRAIADSGARIWLEGVDVQRLNQRFRYPDSPYEVALRRLLQRVDDACRAEERTCVVTADLNERQQDFREALEGYTRVGMAGANTRLERIIGPTWVDSRSEIGVQAADMVVYILRRDREVQGNHRSNRATRSLARTLNACLIHAGKWEP